LDVGHTVEMPGAMSARGISEYQFNLRLAKQIEQKLIDAGFGRTVLLVTTDPPPRGLVKRVVRANCLLADLFLSIHHDGVPDSFLEKWEYEGRENHLSGLGMRVFATVHETRVMRRDREATRAHSLRLFIGHITDDLPASVRLLAEYVHTGLDRFRESRSVIRPDPERPYQPYNREFT